MGKRKRSRSKDGDYDSLRKKMKKLERELQKFKKRSESPSSTDTSNSRDYDDEHSSYRRYYDGGKEYYDHERDYDYAGADFPDLEEQNQAPLDQTESNETIPTETVTVGATTEEAQTSATAENIETLLDSETLHMLGDDPANQKSYGDNLHKDIVPRWTHALINGLSKETKSDLIKQYLPPENCPSVKAPKLNLEIKAAISELNVKKDLFSQSKQNQLGACLAAIGKVLSCILGSKDSIPQAQEIIKALSDAARLLCDCHYRESQTRRYALMNILNKQTRDTIKNAPLDEYLFGSNLCEQLKSSKAIIKSGLEMKTVTAPRVPFKQPPTTQTQRGALNSRGMTRATAGEPRPNPAPRRPAPARRDRRRHDTTQRRHSSTRGQGTRRR